MPDQFGTGEPGPVASAGDDEILTLEALRARLARSIDDENTSARDLAPLTTKLQQVLASLRDARASAADAEEAARAAKEAEIEAFDPGDI